MSDDIKHMTAREFQEGGFLQECNRLFFHPLGLALGLEMDEPESDYPHVRIWDYRDDPEGMEFADGTIKPEKAQAVNELANFHKAARWAKFASFIQPVLPVHSRAPETQIDGPGRSEEPEAGARVQEVCSGVQPGDDTE